jgi:ATP-dependent Zn protease
MEKNQKFSIWYVLLGIWLVLIAQQCLGSFFFIEVILYSQFLRLLKENKITEVAISANQLQGKMKVEARGIGAVGGHDEREQTLNQLLVEMDGFDPKAGVILLASTNRPEILDPTLLRPGRFGRQILVDRPNKIEREEILKVHLKNIKVIKGLDIEKVAAMTRGMVGADLANLSMTRFAKSLTPSTPRHWTSCVGRNNFLKKLPAYCWKKKKSTVKN